MNRGRHERQASSARNTAFDVMRFVAERDAYANLALAARIREAQLTPQDAAFVTELVAGALRHRLTYDRIIELASGRSTSNIDPPLLDILRLAVHQLHGMRTATHAAVHESVELARSRVGQRATGFVNGVLRTITRTSKAEWNERIQASATTEIERLSVMTSHPEWVVGAYADALAREGRQDELLELLHANNDSPRVQLALLRGTPDPELLASLRVRPAGPSPLGAELLEGHPGPVLEALSNADMLARVQDQGSQIAALALVHAKPIAPGEAWLDLCAGPGGKTAVLASASPSVHVRANEVSEHRADLVRESVRAFDVDVVSFDGREDAAYDGRLYDRILVDAPCTGLGALRRRPEARWRKRAEDLTDLVPLQRALLAAATRHLRPGGVLAYVTCSPHTAETSEVVEAHLTNFPELRPLDTRAVIHGFVQEDLALGDCGIGAAQLWPHRHGTDAMFIALFQRTSRD